MLACVAEFDTSQEMGTIGKPTYWHYADHGLGAGAIPEGVCAEHT